MNDPRSILICRLSALGDIVLSVPVADALRERYPGAHIADLSRHPCGRILLAAPSVDQLILWDGASTTLPPEATSSP